MQTLNNVSFRPGLTCIDLPDQNQFAAVNWSRGSAIGSEWTRRSGRDKIRGSRKVNTTVKTAQLSHKFMRQMATLAAYPVFYRKRKTFYLNNSRN